MDEEENKSFDISFKAPIILFTFKRLEPLRATITSLLQNKGASESDVFIFSDAAKRVEDFDNVNSVRAYITSIAGFKSINIIFAHENKGLANSIITGVTDILKSFNSAIVLEDDLITTPNFLAFMNTALLKYENNKRVFSVSGFMFDIKYPKNYTLDGFFTKRHCSWGWAIWKDRWDEIDWSIADFETFSKSKAIKKQFNKLGADLSNSLVKQMNGKINSWAIRCNYHQFKKGTFTLYPTHSKVENIGFGLDATHTKQKFNRYRTTLDQKNELQFNLPNEIDENKYLLKLFNKKFSTITRLYYYLINTLFK